MLKSCRYCGRIHDSKFKCPKQPKRKRIELNKDVQAFRRSAKWKAKSLEIRDRDHHLCQVCLRGLYFTGRTLTHQGISVHHIIPVAEDESRSLDDNNLITLCQLHHELAESGHIPREELAAMVAEVPPGVRGGAGAGRCDVRPGSKI